MAGYEGKGTETGENKEEWIKEAKNLYSSKRYKEALAAYDHALRLDPNYAFAYNGRGAALRNLNRYDEALAAYDHALRVNPNYAVAYYSKGITLQAMKRNREAQVCFDKAKELGYSG